jgi:hypothetical protein
MEYVPGAALRDRLIAERPWPLAEAVGALSAIAEALIYIHANGILHLDLKPENVLCDTSGRLKVTDFGLALHQLEAPTRLELGVSRGSIDYCAPEHRHGLPVDARSDLFSLAVIAYELFTGHLPARVYRSCREYQRALPARLDAVLSRALARHPEERYSSVADFHRELLRATEVHSWVRRHRTFLAAVTVLGAGAIGWQFPLILRALVPAPPQVEALRPSPELLRKFEGHTGRVMCLAVSRDGTRALSGGADKTVRLWDVETGTCLHVFDGFRGDVNSVEFSRDGSLAVATSDDTTVRLFDLRTRTDVRSFEGHSDPVRSAVISGDGQRVLSAGEDGTLRLWSIATGEQLLASEEALGVQIHAIYSHDERHIFSCGADGTVRMWNTSTLTETRRFIGHKGDVCRVALSDDGTRLLSCGFDATMRLWNVETGEPIGAPFDNGGQIGESCSFSPDGKRAICTEGPLPADFILGPDQGIRIWELETGTLVDRIGGLPGKVLEARFTPDGKSILSAGSDNLVRVWKAPP